jgi:hypothetical protein
MKVARIIAALIISASVAVAGIPAQADSACPMAKTGTTVQVGQVDCHKAAKTPTKPGGRCTDPACGAKCSALSGGISIDLPAPGAALPDRDGRPLRLHPFSGALASHLRHTQERPPKSFA